MCWILIHLVIIAAAVASVNGYMVWKTKGRILSQEEWKDFQADGIIVLGCSVKKNGEPSLMLEDRVRAAASFYQAAKVPVMLVSGDHLREEYDEVTVMKELAVSFGVPEDAVCMDHTGLNTYDSIVHTRTFFGEGARVVIVTQRYHLYRALYLAEQLGLDAWGVSADLRPYHLQFKREIREIMARVKDFFYGWFQPELSKEAQILTT